MASAHPAVRSIADPPGRGELSWSAWARHAHQADLLGTDVNDGRWTVHHPIIQDSERPVVKYIVKVRCTGADWADLMADMRSWLDRRQIKVDEFSYNLLGRGVAVCVGFYSEDHAAVFATSFSGRLQSVEPRQAAAQETMSRPVERDPDPRFPNALMSLGDALQEHAEPTSTAPLAVFSLMITRRQKADLRERGYTDAQIRDMTPDEAHRVLGLID